uniref:Uncharacterized protein n=1 Tax=Anguilla anguilla TaxID=7936 RepID=A0A0E9QBN4_ANGAN
MKKSIDCIRIDILNCHIYLGLHFLNKIHFNIHKKYIS